MFSKKTAIAAAALLAGVAAQAQVTLYGNLDVSFGRFEEPGVESVTAVESGSLRESFIGFKGEEDLGGGLKAFFKLESAIGVDDGSTAGGDDADFWGRTSIIGLSGSFGTVTLGNARSLLFLANDAYNPFRADSALFSTSSLLGLTVPVGPGFNLGGYTSNLTNSITYSSPDLSGFTAAVQVGLSEVDDVDNTVSVALNYAAGPLGVNFTYQDRASFPSVPGNDEDVKTWLLSASYDFGAAKLFGQLGQADQSVLDEKADFYQIGLAVPVTTAGNVLVSYGQGKLEDGGFEIKAREFSLAYEHTLSKRTGAYIGVNDTKFSGGGDSETGTSLAVGVRHSF